MKNLKYQGDASAYVIEKRFDDETLSEISGNATHVCELLFRLRTEIRSSGKQNFRTVGKNKFTAYTVQMSLWRVFKDIAREAEHEDASKADQQAFRKKCEEFVQTFSLEKL